jgi:membrane peptidoglycan carboxypeptidase
MKMNNRRRWLVAFFAMTVVGCALALRYELARLPAGAEMRRELTRRYPQPLAWRPLTAISPRLQQAVISWEDPRFYQHDGVSFAYIARAAGKDAHALAYVQGGSTLTQQVVKNLFLTREKTLRRKFDDAVLARRLEHELSKPEILEVYLNTAEWGDRIYGAEAAAQHYFGKPAAELDWNEAALLASLLPNPHRYDPCNAPAAEVAARQAAVLRALKKNGWDGDATQGQQVLCPAALSATKSEPQHLQ